MAPEGSGSWGAGCWPLAPGAPGKPTGHLSTKEARQTPLCTEINGTLWKKELLKFKGRQQHPAKNSEILI